MKDRHTTATSTPILDGVIFSLALLEVAYRRRQPKTRHTVTTRQIYDAKNNRVITLKTETTTTTN